MVPQISIVSPVYMAEGIVDELVRRMTASVSQITDNYEIVLVCDGSPDGSWEKIVRCCGEDERVKGVLLSRNFGQECAIVAGLRESQGNWVVVMDCDLQDDPAMIPAFWEKAREGYDVVFGERRVRLDSFWKRLSSKFYYKVFNYLTDTKQDDFVGNFGLFSRRVVESVLSMGESGRCFTTMVYWSGFERAFVPVCHGERYEGRTSYSFARLMRVSRDAILSFSDRPLRIMTRLGLLLSLFSFLVGLYYFVQWCRGVIDVDGYTSLIISLWFIAGLLIMFMGVLGLYLGKVFEEVKGRPLYVIADRRNIEKR